MNKKYLVGIIKRKDTIKERKVLEKFGEISLISNGAITIYRLNMDHKKEENLIKELKSYTQKTGLNNIYISEIRPMYGSYKVI